MNCIQYLVLYDTSNHASCRLYFVDNSIDWTPIERPIAEAKVSLPPIRSITMLFMCQQYNGFHSLVMDVIAGYWQSNRATVMILLTGIVDQ